MEFASLLKPEPKETQLTTVTQVNGNASNGKSHDEGGVDSGTDDKSDDESAPEDDTMYCICRGKDDGRWMIGCDGCEEWYHGVCVNMDPRDAGLIDQYFCPVCVGANRGTTVWKQKCRLATCRSPAVGTHAKGYSKYCSKNHGIVYFQELCQKSTLAPGEIKALVTGCAGYLEFCRLGDRVPSIEHVGQADERDENDGNAISAIAAKREVAYKQIEQLEMKKRYLQLCKERAKRVSDDLKLDMETPKDTCGYDSRLSMEQVAFDAWLAGEDAQRVLREARIEGAAGMCMNVKNKCKHREWVSMQTDGIELAFRQARESIIRLGREEKEFREVKKQHALRQERDGRVIQIHT